MDLKHTGQKTLQILGLLSTEIILVTFIQNIYFFLKLHGLKTQTIHLLNLSFQVPINILITETILSILATIYLITNTYNILLKMTKNQLEVKT